MPKMLKFAVAPSTGTLVYRSTGQAVRGEFTIRDNRVYRQGRLVGYIGKGTKTEQRRIAEIDKRNASARRRSARRKESLRQLAEAETRYQTLGATMYESIGGRRVPTYIYTQRQISQINFAHLLNRAVSEGKMTREEAIKRWDDYVATESSEGRSERWDDLKGRFEEVGFKYP